MEVDDREILRDAVIQVRGHVALEQEVVRAGELLPEAFRKHLDAVAVTVEEAGPARAVVAVRGAYRNDAGRKIAPFWVRYTANAGAAKIGVEHFFGNHFSLTFETGLPIHLFSDENGIAIGAPRLSAIVATRSIACGLPAAKLRCIVSAPSGRACWPTSNPWRGK